ncbi:MAG: aminotransferase class III-fold pyridoxal phosphate-dependent enzyme, partial [Planktomarina sp.]|nr:aminotransferase class III-fold pyridoxal phosphate-dependent enzyme [Planktomarina sp.]
YHGTHIGGASVNGNANFRTQYEPLLPGCFHVPAPYTFRNPFDETDPEKLSALCLKTLEEQISFQGAETIAAFIMEPVLGAGGVIPPHPTFMPGVREICSKNEILLIADEVITAFGRTGGWTGSRLWGVKPDLMATAKAITNGYFPFGAAMVSDEIAEVFENDTTGRAMIGSGYTYSGHPVGAAAAVACMTETLRLKTPENAAARGIQLFEGLEKLKLKHEIVGDVRGGHGLMCALELVSDRNSKKPANKDMTTKVYDTTYANGTMIRISGPNIILSPPLVVQAEDINQILSCLDHGLSAA